MTESRHSQRGSALRFHLNEIAADLRSIASTLEAAVSLPPDAWGDLRDKVAEVASAMEHLADHHAAELLRATPQRPDARFDEALLTIPSDHPSIQAALLRFGDRIDVERNEVADLAARAGVQPDLDRVAGLAASLQLLLEPIRALHAVTVVLHRKARPVDAEEEDRAAAMSEASREIVVPDGRSLASCPRCDAPLGRDDRTLEGSFCENCSTRWVEQSQA